MPQAASTPKIEELRFRLKSDPKSRLFFPLAEELRKVGQLAEAEQVLRTGLTVHPTYLSAWVSLGRVLRDQKNDGAAVDALNKSLQLDPGNVVAARLLGDAYLALGDKVEAIKKYKLVRALLGTDEELDVLIEQLDRELNPPAEEPLAERTMPPFAEEAPEENLYASAEHESDSPFAPMPEEPAYAAPATPVPAPDPFEEAGSALIEEVAGERVTGDDEPMLAHHDESPFEDAPAAYGAAAFAVESVPGMSVEEAPLAAEVPAPAVATPQDESDVFAPSTEPFPEADRVAAANDEELTQTLTMAELYARQGLIDEARDIYEHILERDPNNDAVRSRLHALEQPASAMPSGAVGIASRGEEPLSAPAVSPVSSPAPGGGNKVDRLQQWLARVSRREVGHV